MFSFHAVWPVPNDRHTFDGGARILSDLRRTDHAHSHSRLGIMWTLTKRHPHDVVQCTPCVIPSTLERVV